MGVPAFYRWLSEKYPKIVTDMIEQRHKRIGNIESPVDLNEPNPNEQEWDNLYIDMNGIIHPCSHPEDMPAPDNEADMYVNVMDYVDRIFGAVRPRKVLFLAIDGVAPRAKMNQQRSRRFRAAQEMKEKRDVLNEVREEMIALGHQVPPENQGDGWDSNVITPGTEFMHKLSFYLRFYIAQRINSHPAWKNIKVILSDACEPGEGEHKIMDYIRRERLSKEYDPNTKHILHGLDADLIMLALATHEAHFTILREQVLFGRQKKEGKTISTRQETFDKLNQIETFANAKFPYLKPFQMIDIPTVRDYLRNEFKALINMGYDFERIIDDFVFLCFFVGNDFLPHLPSLDIRDGALDFLLNVYKRLLPELCIPGRSNGYLAHPGGEVNLKSVDRILKEVGKIEDEVFQRRKRGEEMEKMSRERKKLEKKHCNGDVVGMVANANKHEMGLVKLAQDDNGDASLAKNSLISKQRFTHQNNQKLNNNNNTKDKDKNKNIVKVEVLPDNKKDVKNLSAAQKLKEEMTKKRKKGKGEKVEDEDEPEKTPAETPPAAKKPKLMKEESEEELDIDAVNDVLMDEKEMTQEEIKSAEKALKAKLKSREQLQLDKFREGLVDNIKLWETGWKDRYYADKYKMEDITIGGGKEKVFRTYIEGLCWVMKYYYAGCASWTWYYPFHYAPFASDLFDCDRFNVNFEEDTKPFQPIEQLMAVLPSDSKNALPPPCRPLMTQIDSPIIDFYPTDIEVDPNGKALPWLWVVLLPFIDEVRLLDTLENTQSRFTEEEKIRNSFGPAYVFSYHEAPLATYVKKLKGFSDEEVELSPGELQGFSGKLKYPQKPSFQFELNQMIKCPAEPDLAFHNIQNNKCVCAEYILPEKGPHESKLLPGAIPPRTKLTQYDLQPRRPPRLNRGFNFTDIDASMNPQHHQKQNHQQQHQQQHPYQQQQQQQSQGYKSNQPPTHHQIAHGTGQYYTQHHQNQPNYRNNYQQQSYHHLQQQQQQQQHYSSRGALGIAPSQPHYSHNSRGGQQPSLYPQNGDYNRSYRGEYHDNTGYSYRDNNSYSHSSGGYGDHRGRSDYRSSSSSSSYSHSRPPIPVAPLHQPPNLYPQHPGQPSGRGHSSMSMGQLKAQLQQTLQNRDSSQSQDRRHPGSSQPPHHNNYNNYRR